MGGGSAGYALCVAQSLERDELRRHGRHSALNFGNESAGLGLEGGEIRRSHDHVPTVVAQCDDARQLTCRRKLLGERFVTVDESDVEV